MKNALRRRPSASIVVAVVALVIAATGTAVATTPLLNGDKLIARRSLSGNRLRDHSVNSAQINLGALGTVPNAANANHAIAANNATNAVNAATATSATTAADASMLGGQPPSAFEPSANLMRTGLVKASSGQTVALASFGPFALTLECVTGANGAVEAEVQATSTEAGSDGNGTKMMSAGARYTVASTALSSTTFKESGTAADFLAPSGTTFVADLTVGQNFLGTDCYANALISPS